MEEDQERYADQLDTAQQIIEQSIAEAVRRNSEKASARIESTGACLFCGQGLAFSVLDDLPPRWCDSDCRDHWERERVAKARNGREE